MQIPKYKIIFLSLVLLVFSLAAQSEDPGRLSHDVFPTFQVIKLNLNADKSDYTGHVEVYLTVTAKTDSFRFHAQDMKLNNLKLTQGDTKYQISTKSGYRGLQTIHSDKTLSPGKYKLVVDFENDFNNKTMSLYKVSYEDNSYLFTQFEPDWARQAFPCWDEPSFKFPYQMIITAPEGHKVFANTPVKNANDVSGGKEYVFEKSKPMPSYLLALATGPLESYPIEGMSVPGNILFPKGKNAEARLAAEMTPPILKALEDYFDSGYPFRKLDLIAVPDYIFGAMENPGLVTFKQGLLLLDSDQAQFSQKRRTAAIIGHELAHMWFGDLVTMAWWDNLWLNESFASWMGDKVTDTAYPEFKMRVQSIISTQRIMEQDALTATKAIYKPISTKDDIFQKAAGGITYNKGQAVLEMIESWLGEESFRDGMRTYMKKHAWKNTTADDLWAALSVSSGKDVKSAMNNYIIKPGVPLVKISRAGANKISITQQRLLNIGDKEENSTLWNVPLQLRYFDGEKIHHRDIMLKDQTMTVALDDVKEIKWLHPNDDQQGYYRWSLEESWFRELFNNPVGDLSERERVSGLINTYALVNAGLLPIENYMDMLPMFSKDQSPDVLNILVSQVNRISNLFDSPDERAGFATYYQKILHPVLATIGTERKENEAANIAAVRARLFYILSVNANDEDIKNLTLKIADDYFQDPDTVDPALVNNAIYVSAHYGDNQLFERYRELFEKAGSPAERGRYLRALGRFYDKAIAEKALDYALTGPLKPTEFFTIPSGVLNWPEYESMGFNWFKDNYDKILQRMPEGYWPYLPYIAGGGSEKILKEVNAFFQDPAHQYPGTLNILKQVNAGAKHRNEMRSKYGESIANYLDSQ